MGIEDVKARLKSGGSIINVGQWDKPTTAWVLRQFRAGNLLRKMDYTFPNPRYRYISAETAQ